MKRSDWDLVGQKSLFLFVMCTLQVLGGMAQNARKRSGQPNVLLIYTDDHRYSAVHAMMGEAVQTPNLDELAANGMVFDKTYLMGAFTGATCTPSRAMLLTGRNLFELEGRGHTIPQTHTTLPEVFSRAGYQSYHVGKWHNDMASLARSFDDGDYVSGMPAYLTDQFRMPFSHWKKNGDYKKENCFLLQYDADGKVDERPLTENEVKGPIGTEKDGPHVAEVLAGGAIDYLKGYRGKRPFFMYLAFPVPHDPRQAPKNFKAKYPADRMDLPPSYARQHPFDNGHIVLRDEELAPWPRTPEVIKEHLSDYYATITHLDAQIGKVIQELKDQGLYENTLVVMAGDSGVAIGNHGLMGKQNIYDEDGIHVPFVISGGALPADFRGTRIKSLSYVHDIMPTILDLIGLDRPGSVTGKSLLPVMNGEKEAIREATYHAYRQHQRAYRKGRYKLIEYVRAPDTSPREGEIVSGSRVTQLFDVAEDPWETLDLSAFPEYRSTIDELREGMRQSAIALKDVADGERTQINFWDYYE